MPSHEISSLSDQVDQLMRDNRRLKWLGFFVLVGAVGFVLMGANQNVQPKVLEAERIVLRDKAGTIRASLGAENEDSLSLTIFDKMGKKGVSLGINEGASYLELADKKGGTEITVAATRQTAAVFTLRTGGGGHLELKTSGKGEDTAEMRLYNGDDSRSVRVFSTGNQEGGIQIAPGNDHNGQIISLGSSKDGSADFSVNDKKGESRASMGADRDGHPFIRMRDNNNKSLFEVPKP